MSKYHIIIQNGETIIRLPYEEKTRLKDGVNRIKQILSCGTNDNAFAFEDRNKSYLLPSLYLKNSFISYDNELD